MGVNAYRLKFLSLDFRRNVIMIFSLMNMSFLHNSMVMLQRHKLVKFI